VVAVAETPAAVPVTPASVSNAPVSIQSSSEQSATSAQTLAATTATQPSATAVLSSTVVSNASTITVNAGDTLWQLAQRVRPDSSVSVQQTMLALQRLNPQAFIGGNINRIRRGEILQVPELDQIRQIAATEAVSEVSRQNQQLTASATPVSAQPVSSAPPATAASAGAQGELRVVTVAEDSDNQQADASAAGNQSTQRSDQIEALEDRVSLGEEDLARLDAQNNELNARLALLQQQIASAQEIIRLRDLELAQLQQQLAEQEIMISAEVPPTVITMAPDASLFQRLMHILTSNTWAMLAAAGVLVLLLVLLMVRRNRAAAEYKAQASARENDGMSLGSEDDELLFSDVSEAMAESAASSAAASEHAAAEDAKALNKLIEESSDPADDDDLDESSYNNDLNSNFKQNYDNAERQQSDIPETTALSDSELDDDWQPRELTADEQELDSRFDLDEASAEQREIDALEIKGVELSSAELSSAELSSAELSSAELSSEETGADLEWPDEAKGTSTGDEFDISLSDDNKPIIEDEPVIKDEPAIADESYTRDEIATKDESVSKPATSAKSISDDLHDLAFLPSEDDFTDQAEAEDEEDFDFLSDSDEAATKLDLARAYIDMSDSDGAREILDEVLSEGTEVQRIEAQELLGRL
jgi:pilus assembly protein FimV